MNELALGLLTMGIAKGDRVGIWAPNCAEWVLTQYATAKIGAILVNVNPAYRAHELGYVVRQSGIRLLISAVTYRTSDYRAMLAEIGFEPTVFIGEPGWDELVAAGRRADPAQLRERAATLAFDDPINIQYTSGTTGFPKGATLYHHNILNNGYFVAEGLGYTEDDRVCLPVPLYHCFGMVMGNLAAISHGACVVLPAPGFDPEATLAAVQAEHCTSLYGVPTMFIAELGPPTVRRLRPVQPAYRSHGRGVLPGGGDEARGRRHEHGGGGHLLRHDRDLPGVHDDPPHRRPGPTH